MFGLAWAVSGGLLAMSTEFAITNRRIVAKFGFIRRRTIELLHSKVEGLSVEQGLLGRLLDFGDVVVNGVGAGRTPIPAIVAPLAFRKIALKTIEPEAQASAQMAPAL